MDQQKIFLTEIEKLKDKKHVDIEVIQRFLKRLDSDNNLTKENNPFDHYCSFFLPIDLKSKTVYVGHHIKADDWIPPGGHIKQNESPLTTVYREFEEELNHELTTEKIELFDLSIKDVSGNPLHKCKTHYDFWYLVFIKKTDFQFDRKEFYQAGWFTLKEALKKMKLKQYKKIIAKLNQPRRLAGGKI